MGEKKSYVYMLASKRNGTLYVGVTTDLGQRVWQHKEKSGGGFTQRYGIDRLVYYEVYDEVTLAIQREKQLKKWERQWKMRLVEELNPEWNDLYDMLNI